MQNREAYKKKIYSELELVQARFAKFKDQAKNFDATTKAEHAQHVEKIEQHIADTKDKLKELDTADESVWEELVDGVENTWTALQSTLEDTVRHFKD